MARPSGIKITDLDMLDIIVSRLLGKPLDEIAKSYGVSKQAILYHENKDKLAELRAIVLRRAAEALGDAVVEMLIEKLHNAEREENLTNGQD